MITPSEYYHSYRDIGICPWCHKEKAMLGNVLCFDCWKEKKEQYKWCKSIGICPRCKNRNAEQGKVHCSVCLKQISENGKKRRHKKRRQKSE